MIDHDRRYFRERAEAELDLARRATHPAALRAHQVLAGFYLDRVHNPIGGDAESGGILVARQ
ncbi:MAG TPA: hypothetical protein VF649_05160 [Sphingomonas sp.]|uniref:hypothetical protein n=1 Tax=Sphingomonas sp. TaxID=28214 RepID=UPI002EDB9EEF